MRTGWIETFECDLTDEQKQLCEWVAQRARAGAKRIHYKEAQAALNIEQEKDLTCMLRTLRERLDQIHTIVQSPIVHTNAPYFDIHPIADHIWGRYLHAEEQISYREPDVFNVQAAPMAC
jgi:hypothetical protein